jgi:hypothetical protein
VYQPLEGEEERRRRRIYENRLQPLEEEFIHTKTNCKRGGSNCLGFVKKC